MSFWERRLALACAVGGVILLFAGGSVVLVEGRLVQGAAFTLIAGVALLICYGLLDPAAVVDLVRSRQARFGSLSVLVTAVALGVLITVNVLASRTSAAADLTKARLYTLSPKSALVAQRLDSDFVVTGFFRPNQQDSRRDAQTLLALYQQKSPHLKVQFVDPDANQQLARQLGVNIAGSLTLQYRNKPPVVLTLASQTESDITGAMLRLESDRTPTICWAAGDGQRDLKDGNQVTGYTAAADSVKASNYQFKDVLISQQPEVPAECDELVIMGVLRPISDVGIKSLRNYLDGGGKLLLAVDPWVSRDGRALASVNDLLKPYGVAFEGGLVAEGDAAHSATNDPTTPVVFDFGDSPIAKQLARKYVFFPQPTAISGSAGGGATQLDVATTSDKAYEIMQPRDRFDRQAGDKAGPFKLMETLEQQQPGGKRTRIVLLGSSAIAENRTMPPNAGGANSDLMLATLDWLSEQENLIAISPKPPRAQPLSLTDEQLRFNYLLTLGILPALIAALGITVLLRRRSAFAG